MMIGTSETEVDAEPKQSEIERQQEVRWLALLVLGLSGFVGVVDSSVIDVATPAMQAEFSAADSQMFMLVTINSLAYASSLLLFGKVGHVIGLRRLQAAGVGLFGFSSLLIGLAPSIEFVNGIRIFAGLASAMAAASGLALVHAIFKGRDRSVAFGIWGAMASLSMVLLVMARAVRWVSLDSRAPQQRYSSTVHDWGRGGSQSAMPVCL